MTPDELIIARGAYGYVPARLVVSTDVEPDLIWRDLRLVRCLPSYADWATNPKGRLQYASVNLDAFHNKLLNGNSDKDLLHGLASTVFWGYASGADGRFRVERAIAKTKALAAGRRNAAAQHPSDILRCLYAARDRMKVGDTEEALLKAMGIKFLGMSFASKVLMFMDPSKAAVYDSIIGNRLSNSKTLGAMGVSTSPSTNRKRQAEAYARWCAYCVQEAAAMNRVGHRWKDWDNSEHAWRAVDVERAFFADGQ